MREFIILGMIFISTVTALYPAANYDSIVKSSVLVRPHNQHHGHVTSRNGAQFVITKFQKPVEQPHRALVIHKPVIITSLSNKPATIIETNKNHETIEVQQKSKIPCDNDKKPTIIVTQKQPIISHKKPSEGIIVDAKRPQIYEEKKDDGPTRYTINIEQPKPVQPQSFGYSYNVHSRPTVHHIQPNYVQHPYYYYAYAPQVQPLIPQQYGYAYSINYGQPAGPKFISKPSYAYDVPKPSYDYGVPKENVGVTFVPTKVAQPISHHNVAPAQQFGYSFAVSGQPTAPKIVPKPSYDYGIPKENVGVTFVSNEVAKPEYVPVSHHNIVPVQQFGYSFAVSGQPALPKVVSRPSYDYGVPKENIGTKEVSKPHNVHAYQQNIVPVQQFGYSFAVSRQPTTPKIIPKPSYDYGVPKENISAPFVSNDIVKSAQPVVPQKLGYSYTIHNQPAVGHIEEPVTKPSTEYGPPKNNHFQQPIVVAPFTYNQHLPIVGKFKPFVSQH